MKQLKIVLGEDLRAKLDDAAASAGVSVAEEIRRRLERTLEEDRRPQDRKLMEAVFNLAWFELMQTGHHWYEHPRANEIMRHAVDAEIKSCGGDAEDRDFDPTKVPAARPVQSDNLKTIGLGLQRAYRAFHAPAPGRDWKMQDLIAKRRKS